MSAMNAEFFDAIEQIEKEKGIPRGYMQEKIQQALLTAFKRDNPDCEDNVEVIMDENKKTISMFVLKTIVEESEYVNDATQILLDEAHHYDKKAGIGDTVRIPVETKKFGRIAAQAAKQVIIQGIREAERGIIYDEFTSKEHEILTGVVTRIDPRTGNASLSADYLAHVLRSHAHLDGAAGLGIHPADINLLGLGNKTGHNVSNQFLHEKKPRPCKQGLPFVRISARSFTVPNLQSVSRQGPTVSVSRSRRSS